MGLCYSFYYDTADDEIHEFFRRGLCGKKNNNNNNDKNNITQLEKVKTVSA